jgi:hypothetical protein
MFLNMSLTFCDGFVDIFRFIERKYMVTYNSRTGTSPPVQVQCTYYKLVGFGRACAPVRCAHQSFPTHCHAKRGRCAPRPRPSQLRCFSKIYKIYRTWAAHVKGVFLSTGWTTCRLQRLLNMRSPAPIPPIAASLMLPAIF